MIRNVALLAFFGLSTVFACSDARNTGYATDGGATEAGSIKAKSDGGDDPDPTTKVDSGKKKPPADAGNTTTDSCAPGSVTGFTPNWTPPAALHQSACSTSQISTLIDCLFNASSSQTTCDAFTQAAGNKSCMTCAMTSETAASYGPMILSADNLITLNLPGCIARTANDVSASGCGAKVQAASQCSSAACEPNCPVPDGDQQALEARNQCQSDAETSVCQSYQTDADTCSQPLLQGASSQCASGTTFEDVANDLTKIFCGN